MALTKLIHNAGKRQFSTCIRCLYGQKPSKSRINEPASKSSTSTLSSSTTTKFNMNKEQNTINNSSPDRTGESSFVFLGTRYEKECQAYLENNFKMELDHVGQSGDGGVDLRGWMNLNEESESYRCYIQCKAEKLPLGPRYIRELEGMLVKHLFDNDKKVVVFGGLCSISGFSKQSLVTFQSSRLPMVLLQIQDKNTCVRGLFNSAMQKLVGNNVMVRQVNVKNNVDNKLEQRAVLCVGNETVQDVFT